MADLKTILGASYTEDIASKFKGFDLFEKGKAMPLEKFNSKIEEVNLQKSDLKTQVDALNATLTTNNKDFAKFKKAAEGNEELQKQLQAHEDKFNATQKQFGVDMATKETEWATKEVNNRKSYTLREKLLLEHADPKYIDLMMKEIDLGKITEDNGNFIGVDDVVKGVKTNYDKLFGKPTIVGTGIDNGVKTTMSEGLKALEDKAKSGNMNDRLAYTKAKLEISNQEEVK